MMKFFNRNKQVTTAKKNILEGEWIIDPSDAKAKDIYGEIRMEFTSDGKLFYSILEGNKYSRINLIYWIEDDHILCTDQPSHPKVEKTDYEITFDNKLVLKYAGTPASFIKVM